MAELSAEERAKERLLKFQQAKAKADEEKASHGGFPKEEIPDFKVCVLNKEKPKIIRLIGNSPLMRELPSDPIVVKRSMCITDDGKWATIILSENRDHPVNKLFRTIIGKYKYDKDTKTRTYDNANKPSFQRFMTNGKSKDQINAYEKGMQPDTFYLFNCIDKSDSWCKENKHTKLLCWDSTKKEVDGEMREYYTYGIKPSLYNNIFDVQCTKLNRMYDQFDVVVKRLKEKLGDSYLTVCIPEEKTSISNMGLDPNNVTMDYLTDEEENYEKYKLEDIPFVSRPSSASYVSKILNKLIKQTDIDFGTNLQGEFAEWIEKEKQEWAKKNAENSEKNDTAESSESSSEETYEENEVEETTVTQSFDTMETVEESSDELPSEVEENPTPTVTKKVVKTTTFNPMSLVDKFPAIANMKEEDRKLIIGYNAETDEFKYSTTDLAQCPECGRDIPDPWASCVCGVSFE